MKPKTEKQNPNKIHKPLNAQQKTISNKNIRVAKVKKTSKGLTISFTKA